MNVRHLRWAALAAVMVWSTGSSAFAAISATYIGQIGNSGGAVSLAGVGAKNASNGGQFQWLRNASLDVTTTIYNAPTGLFTSGGGSNFTGFCIDLEQFTGGTDSYDLISAALAPRPPLAGPPTTPMTAAGADRVAQLWASHVHGDTLAVTTAAGRAAMAIALWEAVYDSPPLSGGAGTMSLTGGDFTASASAAATTAAAWLAALVPISDLSAARSNVAVMSDTFVPSGFTRQDMIVELGPGFALDAPEPASFAVWAGLGLVGLAFGWRRRKS